MVVNEGDIQRQFLMGVAELVGGDRCLDYGPPSENHARTAAMWSVYLGFNISKRQVCMMNALQKISRDAHQPKPDSLTDIAGFAANAYVVGYMDGEPR